MKLLLTSFASLLLTIAIQANATAVLNLTPDTAIWGPLDPTAFNTRGTPGSYDYGDAVGYGSAKNTKGLWQGLGTSNGIDDGVKWSVGGSAFDTNADLIIGESVTFKFLFWQANHGNHTYDQIFATFDDDQNNVFDADDTILYEKLDTDMSIRDDRTRTNSRYVEYEVSFVVSHLLSPGTTWLRARAHCWHTPFGQINAYNHLSQGETEDYQFNLVKVPEPSSIALLAIGLIGLVAIRKKNL